MGFFTIGRNLLYLAAEAVLAWVLIGIMESCCRARCEGGICRACCCCCWRPSAKVAKVHEEDVDVATERRRVVDGKTKNDSIVIKNLHKVYPNGKTAVHSLCLGVGDQCFGYLGVNGAGKTSTMKMLTGFTRPSGGTAWLAGLDITRQQKQARRIVGYCPQFDALLDLLTVREHLVMFANLKGVPSKSIQSQVDGFITRMDLERFADKLTHTLSGGNKRKLSAAIALLGRPRVVFLDEPSTGMDPAARR